MPASIERFHPLVCPEGLSLPEQFTCPFHYTPHPLTILAAQALQAYIHTRTDFLHEIDKGKMFGVLIVLTPQSELGYFAAFSGNLAGSNNHEYFVPPVYDFLQPDGFFRTEEANISHINRQIEEIKRSEEYGRCKASVNELKITAQDEIRHAKAQLKAEKEGRKQFRLSHVLTADEEARLIRESQYQKAELKRLEQHYRTLVAEEEKKLNAFHALIAQLKEERKRRSALLQMKLFSHFEMLNAKGETKDLCSIFKDETQGIPPAGSGECALPKLLQYAYLHHCRPLAIGEFWWGASPKDEIRHHGQFYPSCISKCKPILAHMLQGLHVAPNTLTEDKFRHTELDILYEDDYMLALCKPSGMLSVPGKDGRYSVYQYVADHYPAATGPLIVHRLDMDTSGVLLIAKTKEMHERLQSLFQQRAVVKRYTALLQGCLATDKGTIDLPLMADYEHRPCQKVDYQHGKEAITHYEVMARTADQTRVAFYPITGRTHQLRVHAAHPDGLNLPIVGDNLYGQKAERLYLHAAYIAFTHPYTGKKIAIAAIDPF